MTRLFSASPAVGGRLKTRKLLLLRPLPVTVKDCMVQYSARVSAPGTACKGQSYSAPRGPHTGAVHEGQSYSLPRGPHTGMRGGVNFQSGYGDTFLFIMCH